MTTLKEIAPYCCGDIVREPEGRHEGHVEAVLSGLIKVRWPNGWVSHYPNRRGELEIVTRAKRS